MLLNLTGRMCLTCTYRHTVHININICIRQTINNMTFSDFACFKSAGGFSVIVLFHFFFFLLNWENTSKFRPALAFKVRDNVINAFPFFSLSAWTTAVLLNVPSRGSAAPDLTTTFFPNLEKLLWKGFLSSCTRVSVWKLYTFVLPTIKLKQTASVVLNLWSRVSQEISRDYDIWGLVLEQRLHTYHGC